MLYSLADGALMARQWLQVWNFDEVLLHLGLVGGFKGIFLVDHICVIKIHTFHPSCSL